MNLPFLTLNDIELNNRRVMVREDFNVPIDDAGQIIDDTRILRAIPTIKKIHQAGGTTILLSHRGRPVPGVHDPSFSLESIAKHLSKKLGITVPLVRNWIDEPLPTASPVILLGNVRFQMGELENDPVLSQQIAAKCDVFVMDAFATAHRAHASTVGAAQYAPISCAGPLLCEEIQVLTKVRDDAEAPTVAIIGGSKVSTKIELLQALINKVDTLIVGGGIANTFLAATDHPVGHSLYEPDKLNLAKKIMHLAKEKNVNLLLPSDVVVSNNVHQPGQTVSVDAVAADQSIFDLGIETQARITHCLQAAKTIIWNGPVGLFEKPAFANGTMAIAQAVADSSAYSVVGGGETLAAIHQAGVEANISYLSTGGGAFISFIQGDRLPAINMLIKRKNEAMA